MNILYLCDEYPPGKHGGIGTVVQTLARQMVKQGHKVIVAGLYYWGYGGEDYFIDAGVHVYRFRYTLASKWFHNYNSIRVRSSYRILDKLGLLQWDIKRSLQKYRQFLEQLIATNHIDIVEMPDYNDYMRFCKEPIYFPKLSVPVVVKLHGSMTYFAREAGMQELPQIHAMEHSILSNAAAISSVSRYTADKTNSYFKINGKIEVVYNGINTNVVVNSRTKVPGRVVFTGTLVKKKGIYQLMKAWNQIIEKDPLATLFVYGKGSPAKAIALLSDRAKTTVSFKGHVPGKELIENIEKACVGVFPSYAETFGLAPLECMLHKTAVIFSKHTSGPEIVEDNVDGLLVDPDNIDEIANKILYLLADIEMNERLVANAQKMVRKKFDISLIAQHNLSIYEQVLNAING